MENVGDCSKYCPYYDDCAECPRKEICEQEEQEMNRSN